MMSLSLFTNNGLLWKSIFCLGSPLLESSQSASLSHWQKTNVPQRTLFTLEHWQLVSARPCKKNEHGTCLVTISSMKPSQILTRHWCENWSRSSEDWSRASMDIYNFIPVSFCDFLCCYVCFFFWLSGLVGWAFAISFRRVGRLCNGAKIGETATTWRGKNDLSIFLSIVPKQRAVRFLYVNDEFHLHRPHTTDYHIPRLPSFGKIDM